MISPHTRELWRERAKSDGDIRDMIGELERMTAENARLRATMAKSCDEMRHEDIDGGCPRAVAADLEIARLRFDLASRGGD